MLLSDALINISDITIEIYMKGDDAFDIFGFKTRHLIRSFSLVAVDTSQEIVNKRNEPNARIFKELIKFKRFPD